MESVIVSQQTPTSAPEPPSAAASLPEAPLVVIKPSGSWVNLGLRDLAAYRELLYFLIWRDVKVRYKQTALGIIWVVLQPVLIALIFTIFLGKFARVPSNGLPYPLFVYAGLVFWTFFSGAITSGGQSLVGSSNLITKVYFPRMIIPAAAVGARLIDFGICFLNLIGLMIYYRVGVTGNILMLPIVIILLILLAWAVGMWGAALNVKYRDVSAMLPVLIQLWMFASPIMYPSSIVPARFQWLFKLNPLTGILDGLRSSLFGLPFDWSALAISAAITLSVFLYSAFVFRRMEKSFADIV